MVTSECDINLKILLLGDSSVGKTCFLLRYVEDTFTHNHISTIGVDYKIKLVNENNQLIKLQIWDTAGQDRFRCITKNYFRGSDGIMLIYDITNQMSFNNIRNWITQIKDSLGDDARITLVGNKVDLESNRIVLKEDGIKLANEHGFSFFETSAKEKINVDEAFSNLTREMLKKNTGLGKRGNNLSKNMTNKEKKCCL
jgi:small GTP-binding protein